MAKLSTDKQARKAIPVGSGVLDYFPDALAAVAHVSYVGNQQHNPGQPLHWERSKSTDHADCIIRHFLERGTMDEDGTRHSAKMAWRALALLQLEIEKDELVRSIPDASGNSHPFEDVANGYREQSSHTEVFAGAREVVRPSSPPKDWNINPGCAYPIERK